MESSNQNGLSRMILQTNNRLTLFFDLLTEHRNTIYVATPLDKYQRFLSRAFVEQLSSTGRLVGLEPDQRAAQAARKILILRSFIQKYKKVRAKGRPGKGQGTSAKGTGQALLENSVFSRMSFSQIQKVAMLSIYQVYNVKTNTDKLTYLMTF